MIKKKLLLPVFVALSIMLLSPILVSAAETYHFNGKAALAIWPEPWPGPNQYFGALAAEGMINLPGSPGPLKGMWLVFFIIDVSATPPTITVVYAKELTPSEFKWSFGACRVSTEIDFMGFKTLTVEWYTEPPTLTGHIKLKDGIHIVLNGAARAGSATAFLDGIVEPGYIGLVARGTGTIIVKAP